MEKISDNQFLQKRMQKSDFASKLSALKTEYSARGIEVLTIPSDKCTYQKCDGSGGIHFINWTKKVEAMENPSAYYMRDHEIEGVDKCQCLKDREDLGKITAAGIPKRFAQVKVHEFKTDIYDDEHDRIAAAAAKKAAINFVKHYEQIKKQARGLYFYSATKGSGKTRLASSIANALIKMHEERVLFIKAMDISVQVRKTYNKAADVTEEEVLRVFQQVPVLVIDDMAVADDTGFVENLLGKILDHRMDHVLITIVTSNRTIDELDLFYPKGIVSSRLRKICSEILMPEQSIRDEESVDENRAFEDLLFGN